MSLCRKRDGSLAHIQDYIAFLSNIYWWIERASPASGHCREPFTGSFNVSAFAATYVHQESLASLFIELLSEVIDLPS